jgi:hypothetical protein
MTNPQHAQSRDRGKPRPVSIIESPELVAHTDAIRSLGKQTVENVISIGEHLTECRRIVGHGFRAWLKREFNWTYKTADNFMNVHKLVGSRCENFSHLSLPVSSLYLLAAPSTPAKAREEIITRAEKGEKLKVADIKSTIRAVRPAKKMSEPEPVPSKPAPAVAVPVSIATDPWADLDIPPDLDRRPAGPSIEERYRALEIEATGLRSEIEELKLENEHLKRENAELRQGLNPGTADADDAQVKKLLTAMPAIDKKLN